MGSPRTSSKRRPSFAVRLKSFVRRHVFVFIILAVFIVVFAVARSRTATPRTTTDARANANANAHANANANANARSTTGASETHDTAKEKQKPSWRATTTRDEDERARSLETRTKTSEAARRRGVARDERRAPSDVVTSDEVLTSKEAMKEELERELEKLREAPRVKIAAPAFARAGELADDVIDPLKIKVVSMHKPRAYVYESFLADDEIEHVLELASKSGMHKSGVVDSATGGSTTSTIRTSTGTYIGKAHDKVIRRIENRIALWSQIPATHGESLQVLHYDVGQQYKAHFDYFFHESGKKNNRIATVLLYLSDVDEGGETVFPKTDVPLFRDNSTFSECGNTGRAIKGKRGDALLFWSMTPGGELDSGSSHAGCPVIKGEKWTATKWMHVNPVGSRDADAHNIFYEGGPEETDDCKDNNKGCHDWAAAGECDRNPGYMRVQCPMSCRICVGGWRDGSYEKPPSRE